jgi:hypothetical protein
MEEGRFRRTKAACAVIGRDESVHDREDRWLRARRCKAYEGGAATGGAVTDRAADLRGARAEHSVEDAQVVGAGGEDHGSYA